MPFALMAGSATVTMSNADDPLTGVSMRSVCCELLFDTAPGYRSGQGLRWPWRRKYLLPDVVI
jgi:hypothetical protein